MIEITLDRVLCEDGTSVFDLALTGPFAFKNKNCRSKEKATMRARLSRDALKELNEHIEGLLLDTGVERNAEFAQHASIE